MTPAERIRLLLSQRPDSMDCAEAEYAGQRYTAASRTGVTMALARELVRAGCPDGEWEAVGSDGRLRLYGRSLYRLARLTITEGEQRPRLVAYAEAPTVVRGKSVEAGLAPAGYADTPDPAEGRQ